ncbi:MAG: hypothetical protein KIT80_21840 [Chitinophagaceae bacterium]|nr:hypothetical protein [Chitinophagaceae bacterium]MCW5929578.1 hypothetical protein [Chitinophagaceae bacterium]
MEWKQTPSGGLPGDLANDPLIRRQQTRVIYLYLLITILLFFDRWLNGMLLTQLQPSFFVNQMNVTMWGQMLTGIHEVFINNPNACKWADALLLLLPLVYTALHLKNKVSLKLATGLGILIFNFVYVQCYVVYPSNSIEGHIGWLIFPVVLLCHNPVKFSLALRFIRYALLYFFVSAGLWKIRNAGLFYPDQMSATILYQHTALLVTAPDSFLSSAYYWLAGHSVISYLLYLAATLLELAFVIGFFTVKADKILLLLFFVFMITDILVMRIKYWEISYLIIPLFFSTKEIFSIRPSR